MKPAISRRSFYIAFFFIAFLYLLSHLLFLTKLPVFADEAIYIRWAQLAKNEPDKYLFYPMLDGKPPLHSWLIIPFLQIFKDPLFAGRLLSVLSGFFTLFFIDRLIKILGGNYHGRLFGLSVVTLAPYWFFHHRMALAEGFLVLLFSSCLYFGLSIMKTPKLANITFFALSFAASLWTKTNSLFFLLPLITIPLLHLANSKLQINFKTIIKTYHSKPVFFLTLAGFVGSMLFLTLKLTPLFPFLFTRSADYTFTIKEVLAGEWRYVITQNLPNTLFWLIWYLTPPILLLSLFGKRSNLVLLLMALFYIIPLVIIGRVITPRYFFPSVVLFTIMASLGFQKHVKSKIMNFSRHILLTLFIFLSLIFTYYSVFIPEKTPFVKVDTIQYLTDWSSGYGIPQVRDFIRNKAQTEKIAVATEGFFGTLPDGLLMYFDHPDHPENIEIFGIGYPLDDIPPVVIDKTKEAQVYLVVNSHRITLDPLPSNLEQIASYSRPLNGPSLLLFKVHPNFY